MNAVRERVGHFVRELVSDLQQRRLWPVALVLLVALVAVPVVFSKPAQSGSDQPPASGSIALDGANGSILKETQPVVSLVQANQKGFRKSVKRLPRKDPFVQQAKPKAPSEGALGGTSSAELSGGTGSGTTDTGTSTATPGTGDTTSGATSGGGSTGSEEPELVLFEYTAAVAFGDVGETDNSTLQRLNALPSEDNPVVIFMGALSDGKTAVFLVSSEAAVRGGGECKPDSSNCQFLYLEKDDTALIDVPGTDAQPVTTYELRLRAIRVEKIEKSSGASSSRKRAEHSRARSSTARSRRAQKAAQARRERRLFGVFDLIGF